MGTRLWKWDAVLLSQVCGLLFCFCSCSFVSWLLGAMIACNHHLPRSVSGFESPLGRHRFSFLFFNTFFYRFWFHLGSQNGSQINKKSAKNCSKNLIEKLSTFGTDVSSIFGRFWTQLDLKNLQKRCEGCQF